MRESQAESLIQCYDRLARQLRLREAEILTLVQLQTADWLSAFLRELNDDPEAECLDRELCRIEWLLESEVIESAFLRDGQWLIKERRANP